MTQNPLSFDELINEGTNRLKLGEYKQAEQLFIESQKKAPFNPKAYIEYAKVAQSQRNFVEALNRWKTVQELFPNNAQARIGQANAYLELKEYKKAEAKYLKAQKMEPQHTLAFIGYARVAQSQHNFVEALNRWKTVQELFPNNAQARIGQANAYLELKEYKKAEAKYLKAQKMEPQNTLAFIGYARVAQSQRNFVEALKRWKTVQELFPNNAQARIGQANAYLELEEYGEADAKYLEAQKMEPQNTLAFIGYARVAQCRDNYNEVLTRWEKVNKLFPNNLTALIALGKTYLSLKKFKLAETCFIKAQSIDSKFTEAYIGYASVSQIQHKYSESLHRFLTIEKLFPNNIEILTGIINSLIDLEQLDEAENYCIKAQKVFPKSVSPFALHQYILEKKRRTPDENKFLSKAKFLNLPVGIQLLVCLYTCENDKKKLKSFYSSPLGKFIKNNKNCKLFEVYADKTLSESEIRSNQLIVNCREHYGNLSIKTFKMIDFMQEHFSFTHLLKIDSTIVDYKKLGLDRDTYKKISQYSLLKHLTDQNFYTDYNGAIPRGNRRFGLENWASVHDAIIDYSKVFGDKKIPPFFGGKFYLISKEFCKYISKYGEPLAIDHAKYLHGVEDILIGRLYEKYIENIIQNDN